jgi:hypothetical protein
MSYENRAGLDGVVYELLVYEAINRVLNRNDFREAFAGDHSCDPSEVKPSVAFQKGIVLPASIPGKTDEVWRSDCAVTLSIPSKVYDHVFAIQYHWFERNSHIPFWKKMSELARLKIKRPELIVTSILMGINRWKTGELGGFRETFDNHIEAFLPSIETYNFLIEIARQSNLRRGIKDIEEANDFFAKLRSAEQNPQLNEYIRTLQDKLRNLLLGSAENIDLVPVWDAMRATAPESFAREVLCHSFCCFNSTQMRYVI